MGLTSPLLITCWAMADRVFVKWPHYFGPGFVKRIFVAVDARAYVMRLTFPLLITCWAVAVIAFECTICLAVGRWVNVALGHLSLFSGC